MTSFRAARVLVALFVLTLTLPSAPAGATTTTVVVDMHAFSPKTPTVTLGNSVTWSFEDTGVQHTTTSDQGFWNSGTKNAGSSYAKLFSDSGTYPYHCAIHTDMHGTVRVPVKASGTASTGYTLRWSTRTGTSSVRYDVQYKRVGTTSWSSWRTGTASRSATFNPSGAHSYYVHARTHIGTHTSSWSPSITVKVT